MSEIYSDNFPLEETICRNCVYRVSRLITPIDPESFGLTEEDVEEMDIPEGHDIMVEQHTCMILQSDMDYIVKDCNHFKDANGGSFFISNPYE
jgi:hypothetical protein